MHICSLTANLFSIHAENAFCSLPKVCGQEEEGTDGVGSAAILEATTL